MLLQDWWYTTLLGMEGPIRPPLEQDIDADVVVVGAGMAGLSATLRLSEESSLKIVVLEKNICGGSTTGKSAGFLTPDSELELSQILRRFGDEGARNIWHVPEKGIELIVGNVKKHDIKCDLITQDSLFLANPGGERDVREEVAARSHLKYPVTAYDARELKTIIGSSHYRAGVRYGGTYGIDALRYSQAIKQVLLDRGVSIYESTEATKVTDHTVLTHGGSVKAEKIIICSDKLQPSFTHYAENTFHAQTYLTISEPLTDRDVKALFPKEPFQCWDTDLIYSYWRLTGDQRILLGGGSFLTTYALQAVTSPRVITSVVRKFKKRFPSLRNVEFRQYWPGLIDMTRDLFPTVLRDNNAPWIHFVFGCVGLPWASFCGDFAARHTLDTNREDDQLYYEYFRPNRKFPLPLWTEKIIGKPLSFALNNSWAKYYQRG